MSATTQHQAPGAPGARGERSGLLALSVHGSAGVLDLQVPGGASGADVAAEYSRQASLPTVPRLYTRLGQPLPADVSLADAGICAGTVLLAQSDSALPIPEPSGPSRSAGRADRSEGSEEPEESEEGSRTGASAALWCTVALVVAVVAGSCAAALPDSVARDATVAILLVAAVLGCVPGGPWAEHRVLAAPVFAGAAAVAIAWDPAAARLPTILGTAALAAALCAAVARSLGRRAEEGLRVWTVVGALLFALTTGAALAGIEAQVVWSVLLLIATLAARFVPQLAVDVPDHYLLDLERLAVTAWSARERPVRRRGRIVVPHRVVVAISQRAARLVTAASVAVLAVAAVSAPLLLVEVRATGVQVDVVGARCQVGFCGAALLLAARSYRHRGARAALRAAGLACWIALLLDLLDGAGQGLATSVALVATSLGAVVVLVAVALGRGWRSAWWARRTEVAESLSTAFAVASVVAAAGLVSGLWN
ncbi:hypothetical protein [Nocardioides sp.]|uniref:hypothetical protein n=1 Tax=Nocardioides sp. TaxID=35761 RepID=UPI002B27110D|nr:hypothetical protein [Nocardioides sp.]